VTDEKESRSGTHPIVERRQEEQRVEKHHRRRPFRIDRIGGWAWPRGNVCSKSKRSYPVAGFEAKEDPAKTNGVTVRCGASRSRHTLETPAAIFRGGPWSGSGGSPRARSGNRLPK
jgi:hypothetical protein